MYNNYHPHVYMHMIVSTPCLHHNYMGGVNYLLTLHVQTNHHSVFTHSVNASHLECILHYSGVLQWNILDECRALLGEPEEAESIVPQQSCNVVAKGYLAEYGVY